MALALDSETDLGFHNQTGEAQVKASVQSCFDLILVRHTGHKLASPSHSLYQVTQTQVGERGWTTLLQRICFTFS